MRGAEAVGEAGPAACLTPELSLREAARELARHAARDSQPRATQLHLLDRGTVPRLLVVNGSRLYDLPEQVAATLREAMSQDDPAAIDRALTALGLDAPAAIDDRPLTSPPIHALSLAVAQKCNLGCTYCYAQGGTFGGPAASMSLETAYRAVELLVEGCPEGGSANLAFMGGEPLVNRSVLRRATEFAASRAAERGIELRYSVTTNGTLLTEEDARFFEEHGFAVTISLDGGKEEQDLLRPFKNGTGSFDHILTRVRPLLEIQRRMQVSARVTVTPRNMNLVKTLEEFIGMGFHSVGFSPLLRSPSGRDEMDGRLLLEMLEAMIECGLTFEREVLKGNRYPFLNMVNALRELHRGTHRPYPCGAGAGYFGVSAGGDLAACHRFVDDPQGAMGDLVVGIDRERQDHLLATRHVPFQEPCNRCWARSLCGGGCHHEVLARGRIACDFIRGWLHYTLQAHGRLSRLVPGWFDGETASPRPEASAPGGSEPEAPR